MAKKKPLPPRTLKFIDEYPVDLDGQASAIRAGYSPKTAVSQATRLLKDPRVKKAIQKKLDARSERTSITSDKVLGEIAKSGFSDIRHLFDEQGRLKNIQDLPAEVSASIASIEVVTKEITVKGMVVDVDYIHKIKMVSKENSLRDLGKHLKLFTEKHEVSGAVIVRLNNKALRPEDEIGWLEKLTK